MIFLLVTCHPLPTNYLYPLNLKTTLTHNISALTTSCFALNFPDPFPKLTATQKDNHLPFYNFPLLIIALKKRNRNIHYPPTQ